MPGAQIADVEVEVSNTLADIQACVEQETGVMPEQQRFLVVGVLPRTVYLVV